MPTKRRLANLVIVAFLALIFIDTYPGPGGPWARLQKSTDPILDIAGLWQGPWDLFAPDVDRENHHIEVVALLSNGEQMTWRSPNWSEMSCFETFVRIREVEFYDRIRYQRNSPAWSAFADYARRELLPSPEPGVRIVEIDLVESVRPLADLRLPERTTPEPSRHIFHRQPIAP